MNPEQKHILLVGPGNYGMRHLESLLRLPHRITVLGRSEAGRRRTRELAIHSGAAHSIRYVDQIAEVNCPLRGPVDLAIVATCSTARFDVARRLVDELGVRRLILEKVLFDDLRDYSKFERLARGAGASVWVNTKKRTLDAYQQVKRRFAEDRIRRIRFSGVKMGLASNALHIIDLAEYLTGSNVQRLSSRELDPDVTDSKRSGFFEFRGELQGATENGVELSVVDRDDCEPNKILEIHGDRARFKFNEFENRCWVNGEPIVFAPQHQSDLTRNNVDVLRHGDCQLTKLKSSIRQHRLLLNCLLGHLRNRQIVRRDSTICKIT